MKLSTKVNVDQVEGLVEKIQFLLLLAIIVLWIRIRIDFSQLNPEQGEHRDKNMVI
jgi:hypothetical protein